MSKSERLFTETGHIVTTVRAEEIEAGLAALALQEDVIALNDQVQEALFTVDN